MPLNYIAFFIIIAVTPRRKRQSRYCLYESWLSKSKVIWRMCNIRRCQQCVYRAEMYITIIMRSNIKWGKYYGNRESVASFLPSIHRGLAIVVVSTWNASLEAWHANPSRPMSEGSNVWRLMLTQATYKWVRESHTRVRAGSGNMVSFKEMAYYSSQNFTRQNETV